MGLSKKRKQHTKQMTARSLESRKHRKIDQVTQRKKEILRRQREEEDFWDEYEDFSLESSSDELNCDEFNTKWIQLRRGRSGDRKEERGWYI